MSSAESELVRLAERIEEVYDPESQSLAMAIRHFVCDAPLDTFERVFVLLQNWR